MLADAIAKKPDSKAPEKPKYADAVRGVDFKLAEQARNEFEVTVDDGTPVEVLLDGRYWASIGDKLTPRDLLYVSPRSGGKLWIIRVIYADKRTRAAQVALLSQFDLPVPAPHIAFGIARGYRVEFLDLQRQFGVYRNDELKKTNFRDSGEAAHWANEHAEMVARSAPN